MEKQERKPITVYHLHFKDIPMNGMTKKDYYFGSISAIFDLFDNKTIGIKASSLYNYNFDEITKPIYENNRCVIRKDILITKSKNKK